MIKKGINFKEINKIIKHTINAIDSGRCQILLIAENLKKENERCKDELEKIKIQIYDVVKQVDEIEARDKLMRQKLCEVSKNFKNYSEEQVKNVYETASNVRIEFLAKVNEENILKDRRNRLEIDLRKSIENINIAEKVINQVSIAMSYLGGNINDMLKDADKDSEMIVGIKILEAQENERKRIARDIHDGPAQHMANVVMKVDICKKILEKDLEQGFKELADLKESVKVALREVRNIIFDLRPMSLDDLGLNQTIQQAMNTITNETNIEIELRLKPLNMEIESIIQVAVYRIIQEIFNNIKKHSKAKHASLKLDFGTKYLMLAISDDGIGFNVDETLKKVKTKGTSYGLIGILDRVNQLQGEIHIESNISTGTTYKIKLPVNREVINEDE